MIYLASTSPRRMEMLKSLSVSFRAISPEFDEIETGRSPEEEVIYFAREKVKSVLNRIPQDENDALVIGSDTMVVCEGKKIGKPKDISDAEGILKFLSGKTHEVISSLVLWKKETNFFRETLDRSQIQFRDLTPEEIETYVKTGEPMDKAGAYAIQGGAKGFVTEVKGSLETIVGLSLFILRDWLKDEKIPLIGDLCPKKS